MPSGMHKSGRFRKIFVKTPGGRTTVHYREQKPSKAVCGNCKKLLAGMPRERPGKLVAFSKSARRPQRPYGGVLCSACMRQKFRMTARVQP